MSKVYNLMFAGVGGQGSLLIAEITSIAASMAGYDVKQTEVHGVSQRGGSVETHVRFGEQVYSPVVTPGEADVVIGLEKLEAVRFGHFANKQYGRIILNDYEIIPASVVGAVENYPYHAIEYLKEQGLSLLVLQASEVAKELGDGRMANVVMVGALSEFLPIPEIIWHKALKTRLPERFIDGNMKAFAAGRDLAHAQIDA